MSRLVSGSKSVNFEFKNNQKFGIKTRENSAKKTKILKKHKEDHATLFKHEQIETVLGSLKHLINAYKNDPDTKNDFEECL